MTHNSYYPTRKGDQIIWLNNFRNKIGAYQAALGYSVDETTAIKLDAANVAYGLEHWQPAVQASAQGAAAAIRSLLYGAGGEAVIMSLTPYSELPVVPDPVLPGALKRIFAFIKNMKTRDHYDETTGEDLRAIGSEAGERPHVPTVTAKVRGSEVILGFKKQGHMGVWVEGQVGDETEWTFLAIDTSDPYKDSRPLKVAGKPEKRRYRLCFWDDGPTHEWTDVIEVTFGG